VEKSVFKYFDANFDIFFEIITLSPKDFSFCLERNVK